MAAMAVAVATVVTVVVISKARDKIQLSRKNNRHKLVRKGSRKIANRVSPAHRVLKNSVRRAPSSHGVLPAKMPPGARTALKSWIGETT